MKILIMFLISIVIGFPVWWKTTTVYRPDLPFSEINEMNTQKVLNIPPHLFFFHFENNIKDSSRIWVEIAP